MDYKKKYLKYKLKYLTAKKLFNKKTFKGGENFAKVVNVMSILAVDVCGTVSNTKCIDNTESGARSFNPNHWLTQENIAKYLSSELSNYKEKAKIDAALKVCDTVCTLHCNTLQCSGTVCTSHYRTLQFVIEFVHYIAEQYITLQNITVQ